MNESTVTVPLYEFREMETLIEELTEYREDNISIIKTLSYDVYRNCYRQNYEAVDKSGLDKAIFDSINSSEKIISKLEFKNEYLEREIKQLKLKLESKSKPFWKFW